MRDSHTTDDIFAIRMKYFIKTRDGIGIFHDNSDKCNSCVHSIFSNKKVPEASAREHTNKTATKPRILLRELSPRTHPQRQNFFVNIISYFFGDCNTLFDFLRGIYNYIQKPAEKKSPPVSLHLFGSQIP